MRLSGLEGPRTARPTAPAPAPARGCYPRKRPRRGGGAGAAAAEESQGKAPARPNRSPGVRFPVDGRVLRRRPRRGAEGARPEGARRHGPSSDPACRSRGDEGSGPAVAGGSEPFCWAIVRQAEAAARPACCRGPGAGLGHGAVPLWARPCRAVCFVLSGAERGPAPAAGAAKVSRAAAVEGGGGGLRSWPAAAPLSAAVSTGPAAAGNRLPE